MASTGPALFPSATTFPSTTQWPGQGPVRTLDVYISLSGISTSPPVWTWISPTKIRQFSISRTEGETGTATLVLDNRNRDFDPTYASSPYYPNLRPLNRVWLREQFSGETNDMFVGYAESYSQTWPANGTDAITTLTASDELKVLALTQLPLTSPPRATYQDVVAFDNPSEYWTMDQPAAALIQPTGPLEFTGTATDPDPGADKFELGQLQNKAPSRKHHKKPVGRKAPVRHHKKAGPPKPLKDR